MSLTTVTLDRDARTLTIIQAVSDSTPDEQVSFNLRPLIPGGHARTWHSAALVQQIANVPADEYAIDYINRADDEAETWAIDAAGTGAASTPAAETAKGAGVPYDHSAIDHGPDGPVSDGDPTVPPNPDTDAVGIDTGGGGGGSAGTTGMFDPADHTVAEVKAYIVELGDESDPAVIAETQRVKDSEAAGRNRHGLLVWLDARDGVI